MEKGYMDDGNGWGTEEMIKSSWLAVERDKRILAKMGGTVLVS